MFRRICEAFERMALAAERQAAAVEEQAAEAKVNFACMNRFAYASTIERETATLRHREEIEVLRDLRGKKTKDRTRSESGRSSED